MKESKIGGVAQPFAIMLKLRAHNGVQRLPMKNFIKINPASFILGAILGGIAVLTVAADSQHPTVWNYMVVEKTTSYKPPFLDYAGALNQAVAENKGWEIVGSQFIPDDTQIAYKQDTIKIVLRQPKQ